LLEEHGQSLTHIKLDPALIQALAAGAVSEADVRDLISIARDHGIKVIALAVESADILPHLYAVGVNAIQGHFISMPYEELVYPDVFSISLQ
jgi:EAL domain-containing protein (putative c-di-GMP-specific phosphodiesterase class I)